MKRYRYHPDLDFTPEKLYNAAEKKVGPCSRCGALNPVSLASYMKMRCSYCGKRAWLFRTCNTVVLLLYLLSVSIAVVYEGFSPGALDQVFGWSIYNEGDHSYREGIILLLLGGSFILMILIMRCYMSFVFRNERRALRKCLDEMGIWYSAAPENLEIVKKIATLYWYLEDWQRSLAFYEYGLSLSPDDVFWQKDVQQVREKMKEIASREVKG